MKCLPLTQASLPSRFAVSQLIVSSICCFPRYEATHLRLQTLCPSVFPDTKHPSSCPSSQPSIDAPPSSLLLHVIHLSVTSLKQYAVYCGLQDMQDRKKEQKRLTTPSDGHTIHNKPRRSTYLPICDCAVEEDMLQPGILWSTDSLLFICMAHTVGLHYRAHETLSSMRCAMTIEYSSTLSSNASKLYHRMIEKHIIPVGNLGHHGSIITGQRHDSSFNTYFVVRADLLSTTSCLMVQTFYKWYPMGSRSRVAPSRHTEPTCLLRREPHNLFEKLIVLFLRRKLRTTPLPHLIDCGRINSFIYHLSSFLTLPSSLLAEPSLSSTITSILPLSSPSHPRITSTSIWGNTLSPLFVFSDPDPKQLQPAVMTLNERWPKPKDGPEEFINCFALDAQISGLEYLQTSSI
ncbi:hypothetical protein FPSE_10535 [Fusarium pseudograminearum CS3096]|uniref:Uncharacterized protein n=1 Tax=Fusarium pseudograminearum (strain CS3096) TaxID=1028729 RepID=K3V795_FUSPC|nr:hypothetical protein FPSE_10535 [Fusarium pseudograminearum CS3096]EKJ69282.1 hypothetical protein FPSE_10535 [Fusarium pseudograminearum CS3096]